MLERDAMARLQLARRPGDIGVDLRRAGPGVEIDGLAPGLRLDAAQLSSARAVRRGRASRQEAGKAAAGQGRMHHGASPSLPVLLGDCGAKENQPARDSAVCRVQRGGCQGWPGRLALSRMAKPLAVERRRARSSRSPGQRTRTSAVVGARRARNGSSPTGRRHARRPR